MGRFTNYKCMKCGYEFDDYHGTGRNSAEEYNMVIKRMKNGELGSVPTVFFKENPEGIIDLSRQTMKCKKCGHYESVERMTMLGYIDERAKRNCRRTVSRHYKDWKDIDFFTKEYVRSAFPRYFTVKQYFEHKCSVCGGRLEQFDDFDNAFCPECGGKMVNNGEGLWD